MYLLGIDLGSSSIKVAIVEAESRKTVAVTQYPEKEMNIISHQSGWAEQQPEIWWDNLCIAVQSILEQSSVNPHDIVSIGIAYQMHGLVLVDNDLKSIRPSIIWCDSRAVNIGNKAFDSLGHEKCLQNYLNSPGNFTVSKLKWVKENEPVNFNKCRYIMLPGDYIAMKLTGEASTSICGLSEAILWNFKEHRIATEILDHFEIRKDLIPPLVETFSEQGKLHSNAAKAIGLTPGIPVTYRAGDQPNNALSLGVHQSGQIAATGGTSGVIYGISNQLVFDLESRINSFAHVNHKRNKSSIGVLLCINGAGIQYAWMRKQLAEDQFSYAQMEQFAKEIPIGAEGLRILPFGNGSERMLGNTITGAQINNLHFARHGKSHFYRAALEGIAFSFVYGFEMLRKFGLNLNLIRVGNDNLFQSEIFSTTISNLLQVNIDVINTTGAVGAAIGSGIGLGIYENIGKAFNNIEVDLQFYPAGKNEDLDKMNTAYHSWKQDLASLLNK